MKALFSLRAVLTPAILALLLAACGGTPAPVKKKEAEKPPEPVTGLKAFFLMYSSARTWAADLTPLSCTSMSLKDVASGEGKYPVWTCTFVSESRRQSKTFMYAVVSADGGINKGI
ncbi:MAG: hypothetical protein IT162_16280, partial [Bryobacterales bacterium]|nr:hypothetical protein [Bryobacterales bacterium]